MRKSFLAENPSVLWFIAALGLFTLMVTLLSEATGAGVISTSFVKTLGKTLCLCLIAIAMDVVWGYCGILSLGHFAFFGIGGYAIGMWLMYARTEGIVIDSLMGQTIPPTPQEISDAIGNQIFGVVGASEFPVIWASRTPPASPPRRNPPSPSSSSSSPPQPLVRATSSLPGSSQARWAA